MDSPPTDFDCGFTGISKPPAGPFPLCGWSMQVARVNRRPINPDDSTGDCGDAEESGNAAESFATRSAARIALIDLAPG